MDSLLTTQLQKEKDSILKELAPYEKLLRRLDAINILLENSPLPQKDILRNPEKEIAENHQENGYDMNWIWEEKILYFLRKRGTAYASEIAEDIEAKEPNVGDKAKGIASFHLSHLLKSDRINKVGQSGRKYKFGYKE
ncbi:MAG: hypothetical protein ACTHK8_14885 [Ginsengibacter sp.]